MNPGLTTAAFLTGAIVVVGKWANKKPFDVKTAIGVGFYAVGISAMSAVDEKVATAMAVLILVVALLANWIPLSKALGLA